LGRFVALSLARVVSHRPATIGAMKTVETYRWRYTERGRAKTTRFHCSWDDIKDENPDAAPVEGSLILRREPETVLDKILAASGGNASARVG
jgi:hypothetical protein